MFGYLLRDLNTLLDGDTFPAVVPHVGLYDDRHVVLGMEHHFVEHLVEEAYTVLKRASVLIVAVVRSRGKELRDEICVTGVDLYTVKAALASPIDRFAELLDKRLDLRDLKAAMDRRAIEVEPRVRRHRHTVTGVEMRHVSAVTKLDGCFRALGMDGVGHLLHVRNDLVADVELAVKRHTAQIDRAVSDGRHSYSAAGYRDVVVLQLLSRRIMTRHIFEGRRTDDAVPQRNRP